MNCLRIAAASCLMLLGVVVQGEEPDESVFRIERSTPFRENGLEVFLTAEGLAERAKGEKAKVDFYLPQGFRSQFKVRDVMLFTSEDGKLVPVKEQPYLYAEAPKGVAARLLVPSIGNQRYTIGLYLEGRNADANVNEALSALRDPSAIRSSIVRPE